MDHFVDEETFLDNYITGIDWISPIPEEGLQYIFSFLSFKDLLKCAQVSKHFLVISSSNEIWSALSRKFGFTKKISFSENPQQSNTKFWKNIFLKSYKVESNWKEGLSMKREIGSRSNNNSVDFFSIQDDLIVTATTGKNLSSINCQIWSISKLILITDFAFDLTQDEDEIEFPQFLGIHISRDLKYIICIDCLMVKFWKISDGKCYRSHPLPRIQCYCLSTKEFSSDLIFIATKRTMEIFSVLAPSNNFHDEPPIEKFSVENLSERRLYSLLFCSVKDRYFLIVGFEDSHLEIWEYEKGKEKYLVQQKNQKDFWNKNYLKKLKHFWETPEDNFENSLSFSYPICEFSANFNLLAVSVKECFTNFVRGPIIAPHTRNTFIFIYDLMDLLSEKNHQQHFIWKSPPFFHDSTLFKFSHLPDKNQGYFFVQNYGLEVFEIVKNQNYSSATFSLNKDNLVEKKEEKKFGFHFYTKLVQGISPNFVELNFPFLIIGSQVNWYIFEFHQQKKLSTFRVTPKEKFQYFYLTFDDKLVVGASDGLILYDFNETLPNYSKNKSFLSTDSKEIFKRAKLEVNF